ncbi:LamG-like jellyroll fold domain-containing protein [Treponema primitia]|nr:LamG-like jellyroll fold domain-containing protein [Treponema primitia]
MRKATVLTLITGIFLQITAGLYGVGESTLILGAGSSWNAVVNRSGIAEVSAIRPNPVLTLSSVRPGNDPYLDMALSFDEDRPESFTDLTGHYQVSVSAALSAVNYRWSRAGTGAALFSGDSPLGAQDQSLPFARDSTGASRGFSDLSEGPLVITPRGQNALLSSGRHFRDFSIEFWLYPLNMENGEQIISWTSTRQTAQGAKTFQRILCGAAKNRLSWTFLDFFSSPDDSRQMTLSLSGSPVLPRVWSHHLIRFDSDTGLLEYLVDGRLEGVVYATSSGREGGELFCPVSGDGGTLVLGKRFAGLMDEFRLYGRYNEAPQLSKYSLQGGRIETRPLDLGERNSRVLKIETLGGNFSPGGKNPRAAAIMQNEYAGSGRFRFANDSMVQFFIRAADSPYQWAAADTGWIPFEPGLEFSENMRGRYIQLAAAFYPSGDGEAAPYLDEIRILYQRDDPPLPPSLVTAIADDGAVELSWKASPDQDLSGYLVYFGTAHGEYFGESAILGVSPINVGKRTSFRIEGLKNGTLYYFTVAAYDRNSTANAGMFSREVSARPLRMVE